MKKHAKGLGHHKQLKKMEEGLEEKNKTKIDETNLNKIEKLSPKHLVFFW